MALLDKFGVGGALNKVLDSGDLKAPKTQPALKKLLASKKEAVSKLLEHIDTGPKIHYSTSLELLDKLIDNATVELVLQSLPDFDHEILNDLTTLLNANRNFDSNILLPYMKAPPDDSTNDSVTNIAATLPHMKSPPLLPTTCKTLLTAHRKNFTAANLLKSVTRTHPEIWDDIFELVGENLNKSDMNSIVALATSKNPALRLHAARILSKYNNNPVATGAILGMLQDRDRQVHLAALSGLVHLKISMPVDELLKLVQKMKKDDAPLIKILLTHCKDPALTERLIKALFGGNSQIRSLAIQALAVIINVDSARTLLAKLAENTTEIPDYIIEPLMENNGDQFLDAIGELADDKDEKIRDMALRAIDSYDPGNAKVISLINQHLSDNMPADLKSSFIEKISSTKSTGNTLQSLCKVLQKEPEHRLTTLNALTKVANSSMALPDVLRLLNEDDEELQSGILDCLAKITPQKYADKVRGHLLKVAGKLKQANQSQLITLLKELTGRYGLPETDAYAEALEKIKAQDSAADDEFYVPSTADYVPPTTDVDPDDPFGIARPDDQPSHDASDAESRPDGDASSDEFAITLTAGQILSERYKLVQEIGRGGYGSVWLVEDTLIDEQLVMKFLHQSIVANETAVERFMRELRLARKITHTNIIRLFDYLNIEGIAAISMEYFPGEPLSSIIDQGPIEPARVVKITRILSMALQTAHQANVIHRDMKPANILVNENDMVKIVDFGIASAGKQAESKLTRAGTLIGTPTYISPEQIQGNPVDGRTDLYSLGVIMYEMMAGHPPYQAEDPMALVFMHVEGKAKRLDEVNPVAPKELADVVHNCIKPDPKDRYQSMAELKQALDKLTNS